MAIPFWLEQLYVAVCTLVAFARCTFARGNKQMSPFCSKFCSHSCEAKMRVTLVYVLCSLIPLGFQLINVSAQRLCSHRNRATIFSKFHKCPSEKPRCCITDGRMACCFEDGFYVSRLTYVALFALSLVLVVGFCSRKKVSEERIVSSKDKDKDEEKEAEKSDGRPERRRKNKPPPEEFPPHMPKKLELPKDAHDGAILKLTQTPDSTAASGTTGKDRTGGTNTLAATSSMNSELSGFNETQPMDLEPKYKTPKGNKYFKGQRTLLGPKSGLGAKSTISEDSQPKSPVKAHLSGLGPTLSKKAGVAPPKQTMVRSSSLGTGKSNLLGGTSNESGPPLSSLASSTQSSKVASQI